MDPQPRADSAYRLSTAHVIRLIAPFELLIGVAWIVTAVVGPSPGWWFALVAATVVVALAGGYLLLRPPTVLTLTADGYRIGVARGAGRAEARWRDVESVGAAEVGGIPMLIFVLADGGRSALPLSLIGPRNGEAQRDVHERLNTAFGYRRL
jgi:hypothetical protein